MEWIFLTSSTTGTINRIETSNMFWISFHFLFLVDIVHPQPGVIWSAFIVIRANPTAGVFSGAMTERLLTTRSYSSVV